MEKPALYKLFLDSLKDQFIFVDTNHIVQYMNKAAISEQKEGEKLIGLSILDCHNATSRETILEIFEAMKNGEEERLITDNERHRIYMRAVHDQEGGLIGYYERYEPPVKTK